ncbi:MAG: extracellular solute-binding protein [Candidatus Hydrogenedentes bacterium]|nr:extracellular solute-binding protein [Candidatus Hydrogenedentota bacterium]
MAVLGLVLLGGLAGCGGDSGGNVIRVTRNIGGREGFRHHFETWKATFEQANPGWTMELTDLGNADGAQFYKTRIATGDLPEVIMTWQLTNFLADGGNLVPLPDSYYEQFGIPLPTPYEGKRYTSQAGMQIQGIAVNKAMWDDIGVTEPPESWEEWFAAFHKLQEKGYKPLVLGGREWSAAQPLFYALSSDLYDRTVDSGQASWTKRRDAGEVRFATDPIVRQAIETMFYLVDHFVDKGAGSDGYNEEQRDFYGGKGAAWFMGCWMAGDLEPNRVGFDMEYWPVPSMIGRPPVFICTSAMPNGWAVTTSATGEKLDKAMAVMEAFYDPGVYQAFLNGECQFGEAAKVPAKAPQYDWAPAQHLIENMSENLAAYGTTRGFHIALDDMPPPSFHDLMARVMQEIVAGTRDIDRLLQILDDEWESARKGM